MVPPMVPTSGRGSACPPIFFTSWPPAPGNGKPMVFVVPWLSAMENLWFLSSSRSRQWEAYGFCDPLTEGDGKPMVSVVPWIKEMEDLCFFDPLTEGDGKPMV